MKFEEAQKNMIDYLSSDMFKTREDAESTQKSVPTLIEMNRKGFVTTSSQEGDIDEGYNECNKMYYEIKERAFVQGIMKKVEGFEFIYKMNINTNKIVYYIIKGCESVGLGSRIAVTCSREGEALPLTGPWESYTALYTAYPAKIYEFTFDCRIDWPPIDTSEDIIEIMCVDPEYGRQAGGPNGLYQDILAHL